MPKSGIQFVFKLCQSVCAIDHAQYCEQSNFLSSFLSNSEYNIHKQETDHFSYIRH